MKDDPCPGHSEREVMLHRNIRDAGLTLSAAVLLAGALVAPARADDARRSPAGERFAGALDPGGTTPGDPATALKEWGASPDGPVEPGGTAGTAPGGPEAALGDAAPADPESGRSDPAASPGAESPDAVGAPGRVSESAPKCVRYSHSSGIITQTVTVENRCPYTVSFSIRKVGLDSPCYIVRPGKGKWFKWANGVDFQGIRWGCV
ncbi:hypothetical protein ACFYSC_18800 [Streptosporangium sp. NPDC004379]|uniref:hypothetical protein n=1 Tax=Streptosporangium sp. NPDC004379 TaxID=3366189 RepID=UPI0036AFE0E7